MTLDLHLFTINMICILYIFYLIEEMVLNFYIDSQDT